MIKRYYAEIHDSCDYATLVQASEGDIVEVEDVVERLEEIAEHMGGKGPAWLMLTKLIEELK